MSGALLYLEKKKKKKTPAPPCNHMLILRCTKTGKSWLSFQFVFVRIIWNIAPTTVDGEHKNTVSAGTATFIGLQQQLLSNNEPDSLPWNEWTVIHVRTRIKKSYTFTAESWGNMKKDDN